MKVKYEDRLKQKLLAITTDTLVVGVDIAMKCYTKVVTGVANEI